MTEQERYIEITTLEIEIICAAEAGHFQEALYLQEELNKIYNS